MQSAGTARLAPTSLARSKRSPSAAMSAGSAKPITSSPSSAPSRGLTGANTAPSLASAANSAIASSVVVDHDATR